MNDTRSWRTPLVPYQKNTKLTISSWFWLPPAFLVFSLPQFCSFCHITASTVSSTLSKIFWVVPKAVKIFQLSLNSFYFHSFYIAVQIEMQEPWNSRTFQSSHTAVKTKNSRINSVFALIALIELVRQVLWVANGVMRQKNVFLQKLNLEKR